MLKKIGSFSAINVEKAKPLFKSAFVKGDDRLGLVSLAEKAKRLMPNPSDFLIAEAIMMHSAEAALIDQETGLPILSASGKPVSGGFIPFVDDKGEKSVKWESSDNIEPYKNGNGDIFPEEDLLLAYKEWIGKPLCADHISDVVDGVRGVIIDVVYDPTYKRVHALFALDRVNFGPLARKIEAGYATSVSMGTGVGMSICTTCANVARVEADYCSHVINRTCYGEINKSLSPIELSIVVTGADSKAKIRSVLANLKTYQNKVSSLVQAGKITKHKGDEISTELDSIEKELSLVDDKKGSEEINTMSSHILELLVSTSPSDSTFDETIFLLRDFIDRYKDSLDDLSDVNLNKFIGSLNHLGLSDEKSFFLPILFKRTKDTLMSTKEGLNVENTEKTPNLVGADGSALRSEEDYNTQGSTSGSTGDLSFSPEVPQHFANLSVGSEEKTINDNKMSEINRKISVLAEQMDNLSLEKNKESPMTFSDLKRKALKRKSYLLGTEDPTEVLPYERMGDDDKIRTEQDKQMVGDELDTSVENPDMEKKKMIQRAELKARMERRVGLLNKLNRKVNSKLMSVKDPSTNSEKIIEKKPDGSVAEYVPSAKDGKEKEKMRSRLHKEDCMCKEEMGKKKNRLHKEDCMCKKEMDKKKAYLLGTEDPSVLPYPLMGDDNDIRENEDRHMLQTEEMGSDGLASNDEELKRSLMRIANKTLTAKLKKSANRSGSKWSFFADGKEVFSVKASQAYGKSLNKKATKNSSLTFSDFFHSASYGKALMKLVRKAGPLGAEKEMGLNKDMEAPEKVDMEAPEKVDMEAPEKVDMEAPEKVDMEAPEKMDMEAPEKVDMEAPEKMDMEAQLLEELRRAVREGAEKIEIGIEEIKSAIMEEPGTEGLADIDVSLDAAAPSGELPSPIASVTKSDMLEAYAFLSDMSGELTYLKNKLSAKKVSGGIALVARQALRDATMAVKETSKLARSFKFASDCKSDEAEADMVLIDHDNFDIESLLGEGEGLSDALEDLLEESADVTLLDFSDMKESCQDEGESKTHMKEEMKKLDDMGEKLDSLQRDVEGLDLDHEELKKKLASRKLRRARLVAKASQFDELYENVRAKGGADIGLGPDSKVETLIETHETMVDLATRENSSKNVREAARKLDEAIKSGAFKADKLASLISIGAVDAEAAKFWSTYYGDVDGGTDFASGLVKDFNKVASSDDAEAKIIRYKRAYAVGQEAQSKGLVLKSTAALNDFVDNLVNVPDAMFESTKRLVAQTQATNSSVSAPIVGQRDEGFIAQAKQGVDDLSPTFENLAGAFLK